MKIVLLRHGQPDVPELGKLSASEVYDWIELYNAAGLMIGSNPSVKAMAIANECHSIVCSDLPRSLASARALGIENVDHIETLFVEVGLPCVGFPLLKLSVDTWAVLFRVLWFLGYSPHTESFTEAKARASNGADRLRSIAKQTGSVLLVGHGVINRLIAKELLSKRWQGSISPGKKHWEFGVYEYENND